MNQGAISVALNPFLDHPVFLYAVLTMSETVSTKKITWALKEVFLNELKPYSKNPRQLTKTQYQHLVTSLDKFGLIDKPIVNRDMGLIGGHQRVKVLQGEGVDSVECWFPSRQLTDKEVEELCIRLNRNTGDFDWDVLANEWEATELLEWGFEEGELGLGEEIAAEKNQEAEEKMAKIVIQLPDDDKSSFENQLDDLLIKFPRAQKK